MFMYCSDVVNISSVGYVWVIDLASIWEDIKGYQGHKSTHPMGSATHHAPRHAGHREKPDFLDANNSQNMVSYGFLQKKKNQLRKSM